MGYGTSKRALRYEVQPTNDQECAKINRGGTKMSKGSKIHDITGEQLFNGLLLATLERCLWLWMRHAKKLSMFHLDNLSCKPSYFPLPT